MIENDLSVYNTEVLKEFHANQAISEGKTSFLSDIENNIRDILRPVNVFDAAPTLTPSKPPEDPATPHQQSPKLELLEFNNPPLVTLQSTPLPEIA